VTRAECAEIERHVLAPVVVKDHAADVTAASVDRHGERVFDELSAHVVVHREADDAPTAEILDVGEVVTLPPLAGHLI
jgi:hypothetical protein